MNCCICKTNAIVILKYRDRLGKKITEPRCQVCAEAVDDNEKNTIKETIFLENKTDKTDMQREFLKKKLSPSQPDKSQNNPVNRAKRPPFVPVCKRPTKHTSRRHKPPGLR